MIIEKANIVSCFSEDTIGTKVVNADQFMKFLTQAVSQHDFCSGKVAGQGFIPLPKEALETVSCGVGKKTTTPQDYHVRVYRGEATMYLRRECAAKAESLAAIVYTKSAYLSDPDVSKNTEEVARINDSGCSHVLVAVLASAGPKAPHSPWRFVCNLAGGNKSFAPENTSVEELAEMAQATKAYYSEWWTVADEAPAS